jgi:hypothetical protein
MSLGDSEGDMVVRASARRAEKPTPLSRLPPRCRPLSELIAELDGIRKLYNELLAAGDLRHASELCPDLDRLTADYGRRRNGLPIRPPL